MFKRLRIKRQYLRVVAVMSLVFLLVAALYSWYLTSQVSRYAVAEVNETMTHRLSSLKANLEFTLQRLKITGLKVQQEQAVRGWFAMQEKQSYRNHLTDQAIVDFLATERLLSDIYLFHFTTEEALSARGGVVGFDLFPDQDFLRQALDGPRKGNMRFYSYALNGQNEIVLLLEDGSSGTARGAIALVLDKQQLENDLLMGSNEFNSRILLLDEGRRTVLGAMDESWTASLPTPEAGEDGRRWQFNADGKEWGAQSIVLSSEGWHLYLITPLDIWKKQLFRLNLNMTGMFFAMVAFVLLVLYVLSKRNYKPFSEIADRLSGLNREGDSSSHPTEESARDTGGRRDGRDYTLIQQGIDYLFKRVEEQNQSLKSSGQLVKEDMVRQWLLSSSVSFAYRARLQSEIRIDLDRPLQIAVGRIEQYGLFCQTYDFHSRKLLKYAIRNIMEETTAVAGLSVETADPEDDHIVILFPAAEDAEAERKLLEALELAKHNVAQWLNLSLVIGFSDALPPGKPVYEAYRQTYEQSMLSFITGDNRIYLSGDLRLEAADGGIGYEQLNRLVQAVRVYDRQVVGKLLDTLFMELQSLSARESKLQSVQLLFMLQKSFRQLDSESFRGMTGIRGKLDEFGSLKELRLWLEQWLEQIMRQLAEQRNQKTEVLSEVKMYVNSHLHNPALTVEEIAEHISLSPNYLRTLFKNHFDISLSDYVLEQRVAKVKQLLVQTNWAIGDIAAQSGFQTKSHFFTAFKKATGTTPSKYREDHSGRN